MVRPPSASFLRTFIFTRSRSVSVIFDSPRDHGLAEFRHGGRQVCARSRLEIDIEKRAADRGQPVGVRKEGRKFGHAKERIDTKVPVSTHTGRDPTVRPQPGPTREKDRRRPTSLGHRALGQYQPQSAPRCRPTPLTRRVQKSSEECDFWKGFESIWLLHSLHRSFSVTVLQCHGRLVRWP